MKRVSFFTILISLAFILILFIILSASMGYIKIPPIEVFKIIISKLCFDNSLLKNIKPLYTDIVINVRLPRILAACLVGAGLAFSGVSFQGILLNPLAEPYTLGISAGAAFGASIALLFITNQFGIYIVTAFAFLGAIFTIIAVLSLASSVGYISSNNLILAGIIVSSILSAGISLLKYIADERVSVIIFWLLGSFASETWLEVLMVFIFVVIGFLICFYFSRDLNVISLGERTSASLGINAQQVRMILLITCSLVTAACVAISGIIGFVGLVVPHLMRLLVGADNRKLIPLSALFGAILLIVADTLTRAVLPWEVPIGVLTSLIGGPFFCYIFKVKTKHNELIK